MRIIEYTIPTRHNMWIVSIGWGGVSFFVEKEKGWRYEQQWPIPKTILKRAKSFLKDPERFGKVRYV